MAAGMSMSFTRKGGWGKLGPRTIRHLEDAVAKSANLLQGQMKAQIEGGTKSGRVYKRGSRPDHQASAPGESPASDTAQLVNSIQVQGKRQPLERDITCAAHGLALEDGFVTEDGTKVAPRPWIAPAAEKVSPRFGALCEAALARAATEGEVR